MSSRHRSGTMALNGRRSAWSASTSGSAETQSEVRMSDYLVLNARLIVEKAFVDMQEYAVKHMPRVMREIHATGGDNLAGYVEGKVQRDLVMEIRAIAMQHIPEGERYRYISKLKEF